MFAIVETKNLNKCPHRYHAKVVEPARAFLNIPVIRRVHKRHVTIFLDTVRATHPRRTKPVGPPHLDRAVQARAQYGMAMPTGKNHVAATSPIEHLEMGGLEAPV